MFANRWLKLLIVLALVAVALITLREAVATAAIVQQGAKVPSNAGLAGSEAQKPLTAYSADEITAYRWEAIARYYEEQFRLASEPANKPLTEYDAAEALAYRWKAMAKYYQDHGLLTR